MVYADNGVWLRCDGQMVDAEDYDILAGLLNETGMFVIPAVPLSNGMYTYIKAKESAAGDLYEMLGAMLEGFQS